MLSDPFKKEEAPKTIERLIQETFTQPSILPNFPSEEPSIRP